MAALGVIVEIFEFVESTYKLFESFNKPLLATDINHCDECRDHNEEVNGASRRELSPEQIGTVCWGISSFLTPQAMGYYIPRLIELAVTGQNDKYGTPYMCMFVNQIGLNSDAKQFSLFSKEQRQAVQDSLVTLKNHHINTLAEHCWDDDLETAINRWAT